MEHIIRGLMVKLEGSGTSIEWLRWHPRGHLILAGLHDNSVWLWNADNPGENAWLNTFHGHASSVTCSDFTPDGHPYHTDGLTCLSITYDSTIVIGGSIDSSVRMVNITPGKVVSSLTAHTDSVEYIRLSSSYPWAATGSMDQTLKIWVLQRSFVRYTCDHEEGVTCLAWLGASRYVATGCIDGKVRVWDSLSGSCLQTFSGHANFIQSLAVSKDGNNPISVSNDRTAQVFEISEFRKWQRFSSLSYISDNIGEEQITRIKQDLCYFVEYENCFNCHISQNLHHHSHIVLLKWL